MSLPKNMPSAVYVMEHYSAEGLKIGRSGNPERRAMLMGGQIAYATPLLNEGWYVERETHAALRQKRLQGEWFAVTIEEAVEAISQAMATAARRALPANRGIVHIINVGLNQQTVEDLDAVCRAFGGAARTDVIRTLISRAAERARTEKRKSKSRSA